MELSIKWTDFSKKELKNIFDYYKVKASPLTARKIVAGIVKETVVLKKHPKLEQIEELLKNDTREFRCLVFTNYKIIYHIKLDMNTIEIFDVFDTRQNPIKIGRAKQ